MGAPNISSSRSKRVAPVLDETVADRSRVHGPRQVTDLYLLALAVKKDATLVTFDGTIPLSAIHGATRAHLVAI